MSGDRRHAVDLAQLGVAIAALIVYLAVYGSGCCYYCGQPPRDDDDSGEPPSDGTEP